MRNLPVQIMALMKVQLVMSHALVKNRVLGVMVQLVMSHALVKAHVNNSMAVLEIAPVPTTIHV